MTPPKYCKVRIENATLTVSVLGDPANTQKLADQLTRRINRISDEQGTINSYHFALQAALELAHEMDQMRREQEQQDQEVIRAFTVLIGKVRALISLHTPKDIGGEEEE